MEVSYIAQANLYEERVFVSLEFSGFMLLDHRFRSKPLVIDWDG